MSQILEIKNISKNYGDITALSDISLKIESGNVFGILGPNGSGKTTLIGIILNIINSDQGTYSWFGNPPSKYSRKKIGTVLETANFFPYLSAYQNLKLLAVIKGVPVSDIDRVLQIVNLTERKNSKFKGFSLGMQQRLSMASALLGNPEVLVLDEPTNGLDPQGIVEVRNIIVKVASEGKTIILASHILNEVEKVCTHVGIIKTGELKFLGAMSEIVKKQSLETKFLEITSS